MKCNGQISGAEENLARGLVAEYLSGARVEFVLDPLDIGIGQNREVGTFWEVLPEEAVSVALLTDDSQIGANLRVCADEENRADFDQRR